MRSVADEVTDAERASLESDLHATARKQAFSEILVDGLCAGNLKQRDFAEKTGINKSLVSLYSTGHRLPRRLRRAAIARALGRTPADLEAELERRTLNILGSIHDSGSREEGELDKVTFTAKRRRVNGDTPAMILKKLSTESKTAAFAEMLDENLESRHLSKKAFAAALGVKPTVVSRYTTGQYLPQPRRRAKIARFFKRRPYDFEAELAQRAFELDCPEQALELASVEERIETADAMIEDELYEINDTTRRELYARIWSQMRSEYEARTAALAAEEAQAKLELLLRLRADLDDSRQ